MASISRPTLIRDIWEEEGGIFNITTAGVKVIDATPEKRKFLPGSTVCNTTSSGRQCTFYCVPKGVTRGNDHIISEDLPLTSRETVEVPQWFIPPQHEVWVEADANSAVNAALCWKVEAKQ